MTHYVYIAASPALIDWSNEAFGRSAIKVGETKSTFRREHSLSGRDPDEVPRFLSCCGCTDWKIVVDVVVRSKEAALDLEARFKAAFDILDVYDTQRPPFLMTDRSAGEGDIVLLPKQPLAGTDLAKLDTDVRDLYLAGRSRLFKAFRFVSAPED